MTETTKKKTIKKKPTKKKVNKSKPNTKKIVVASIVTTVILIYFLYNIIMLILKPTEVFIVEEGNLSLEESSIGYIIREETVIQGKNYKNGIVEIKAEGQRVAKGNNIFRYYSNNEESLTRKIQDLDIKIQEALEEQTNIFSSDIKLLENQIEEKLNLIAKTNDMAQITEYKKEINTLITKKAKIIGELSPSGSYIKKLISERSKYENQLNSGSEYLKAPCSGVVSYKVDGLEEVLTLDSFSSLTEEFLSSLSLRTGQVVASSEESGKVINNFECYIATVLDSNEVKEVEVGDKFKIRLSNLKEITATIAHINEESNGARVIIFKITECVEELINYRKISIDVIWWSATGLKVPNSSIITEGELSYVVRNRGGYTDKILVKVLKQSKEYSIIDSYSTEELQGLGFDLSQISSLKTISLYDEIFLNSEQ